MAIAEYKKQETVYSDGKVVDCGLVVNPKWPWIGCSPDGVILDNSDSVVGCIEVKCPYGKRDETNEQAVASDKSFFLKKVDDRFELKTNHAYYYQCQGVMNILELPWIDFTVYTLEDLHVQRINRDLNLWKRKMLPALTSFYCKFVLPN